MITFEEKRIHFNSDIFAAVAVVVAKASDTPSEYKPIAANLNASPTIDADTPGDFFSADRDDVDLKPCSRALSRSVLKSHVIKSPNLIS